MYNSDKKELKFNENGKFRVLMISDFHGGKNYSPKLKAGIEALIKETNPDFVMIGGDQCLGFDQEYLRNSLTDILEPIQKRNIPWAHVYGNHDHEQPLTAREQQAVYESFPLCLSQAGPADVQGVGNYVLPVYSSKSDKIAYNIFALDSNREISDYIEHFGISEKDNNIILPNSFGVGRAQAMPFFNQVRWYYRTSREIEQANGSKIPAILCMHNPLLEHNLIHMNPEECRMVGHKRECVCCSELNSGLFFACLQRGDVKGIFCGHEHMNTYHGTYCGIVLAYDGCVGYNMTAHDDLRGGRIIDLDENTGTFETKHITLMEIMGDAAIRDPGNFQGGLKYFIRGSHLFDQAVPLKDKVYVKR